MLAILRRYIIVSNQLINALITTIASAIRQGATAETAATATGVRRAIWATLTPAQQAQVLAVARQRAGMSEEERR